MRARSPCVRDAQLDSPQTDTIWYGRGSLWREQITRSPAKPATPSEILAQMQLAENFAEALQQRRWCSGAELTR
jgi:hypothetical protein